MTRTPSPETKARIRQSPLPVIGAVVAIILVVFYGWSQRGWLINVSDINVAVPVQAGVCVIVRRCTDVTDPQNLTLGRQR